MKKTLLFLCVTGMISYTGHSQSINFDNYVSATNNDLVNNFHNTFQITADPGNGITGGAVKTVPFTYSNANAIYNTLYRVSQTPLTVSICFKYSSALFQSGSSYGAAEIFYNQIKVTGAGEDIRVSNGSSFTEVTAYLNGNSLANGHWYKLISSIAIKASDTTKLTVMVTLQDIGTSGTSNPVTVTTQNSTIDNSFTQSHDVTIAINGSERGGGSYLDNLSIQGQATTGVKELNAANLYHIATLVNNVLPIEATTSNEVSYTIYSLDGKVLIPGKFTNQAQIDIGSLSPAEYVIVLLSNNTISKGRFIKL